MKTVQPCFQAELDKAVAFARAHSDADFLCGVVADTHLSDNGEHTRENIAAVDERAPLDCLIHLGDFLTGQLPEKVSRRLFREEAAAYRAAVASGRLFPVQGNHDGYRNESYAGQLVDCISLDENWAADTAYLDALGNVHRPAGKPYYYVDVPERALRLFFLCTNGYTHNPTAKTFKKRDEISPGQLVWLAESLSTLDADHTVMVFSHIHPFVPGKPLEHIPSYKAALDLLHACHYGESCVIEGKTYDFSQRRVDVAAWFHGHDHSDSQKRLRGINIIGITSETAYIPQLWEPIGVFPAPRDLDTASEDAWDVMAWHRDQRTIYLSRFGAGKDKLVRY